MKLKDFSKKKNEQSHNQQCLTVAGNSIQLVIRMNIILKYYDLYYILLEYLERNGGVLYGNNDPTMVQIQDMMFLFENLKEGT